MVRSRTNRTDASQGWLRLKAMQATTYEWKLSNTRRVVEHILEVSQHPAVCWSGGKDSTVLLHIVRQLKPDIHVLFNRIDVLFEETKQYVERMADQWGLNLSIVEPTTDFPADFTDEGTGRMTRR